MKNGRFAIRRQQQALSWMWERIEAGLRFAFKNHPAIQLQLPQVVTQVAEGRLAASTAARQLLTAATELSALSSGPRV